MRRVQSSLLISALLLIACPAGAATGRIVKVLPEFLDKDGRTSLSPSLYERDAYQAALRLHPERRSGLRFFVQWKIKGAAWEPLYLKLELRGVTEGNVPKELGLSEKIVNKGSRTTHWAWITLSAKEYQHLGSVTAWRASLWEGRTLLAQQQSFLW